MLHDSSIHLPLVRLASATVFFLDGLIFASWVSRIPAIQEGLHLRNAVLAIALLATSVGAMITMPLMGMFIARRGSRFGVLIAIFVFAMAPPLAALTKGVASLSFALLLFGVGFGAMNIAANAQAVSIERVYARPIMSSFHAVFSFGGIAGALLGSVAAARSVTPLVHFAAVSLSAIILAPIIASFLVADTKVQEAPVAGMTSRRTQCLLLGAIAFCSMFGEGAMADWSAVFLRQVSLATASHAAIGFAAFSLMMTLGRLVGDRVTIAIGPVNVVRLGGSLAATGLLIAMVLHTTPFAIIGFGFVGAGLSTLVPTVFSAAGRIPGLPPSVGIATVSTLGYFGFLSGPPLIGVSSEAISLRWAMLFVFAAAGAAVVLARNVAVHTASDGENDEQRSVEPLVSPSLVG